MPSGIPIAQKLREEGIEKVNAFLTSVCSARPLWRDAVTNVDRATMIAGWEFGIQCENGIRRLQVLLDEQFPFSIPYFFLLDRPPYLTWPHIERDGFLCLITGTKAAKPQCPAEMVGELFADAFDLIRDCETGANLSDFQTGFETYWERSIEDKTLQVLSLLNLDGKSRFVQIWRGETTSVIGESEAQVLAWQRNRLGDRPQFDKTDTALLLWLAEAILPSEYPTTAAGIYRLAQASKLNRRLLERFARIGTSPFHFVLAADTRNGPCLAAVKTSRPMMLDVRGKRRNQSANGFRPGKVSPGIVAQRLFSSSATATRIVVKRVDSDWVHGRGHDTRHRTLRDKKVLLLGCGSVGGPLAHQLVMAGIGSISIIDHQLLSWTNIGRHPLGAEYVDKSKAVALARELQKNFPHARVNGFLSTYEAFALEHPEFVKDADLIISATAEWETENLLNLQKINGEIGCPLLYTWTEPHACAGHAVAIVGASTCLQCGMTSKGAIRTPLTVWKGSTETLSEPACGAVFQPYGPVELQGTISVAASITLDVLLGKVNDAAHRVWAGPKTLLLDAGGDWSNTWRDGNPEREMGGMQTDLAWPKDDLCPACGGGAIGTPSPSASVIQSSNLFLPPASLIT
jgi:hypothetical protein